MPGVNRRHIGAREKAVKHRKRRTPIVGIQIPTPVSVGSCKSAPKSQAEKKAQKPAPRAQACREQECETEAGAENSDWQLQTRHEAKWETRYENKAGRHWPPFRLQSVELRHQKHCRKQHTKARNVVVVSCPEFRNANAVQHACESNTAADENLAKRAGHVNR